VRLIEQFRVQSPDGRQHTVACYQDSCEGLTGSRGTSWERVDSVRRYCLNGAESIERVDDDTFVTGNGVVLKRDPR
jgi:hypothetical protein